MSIQSGCPIDATEINNALANKVTSRAHGQGTESYFYSLGNQDVNGKTIVINMDTNEQFVYIFGVGNPDKSIMSMIGGSLVPDVSFGNQPLTSNSKNGSTVVVTLPSYFRGILLSYCPFTISGL